MKTLLIILSAVLALPTLAVAQSPTECAPTTRMDRFRLLRQLSLDIRGRIPSYDEYEALRVAPDSEAAIDAAVEDMLAGDEYLEQVRAYHRGILWGSLDGVDNLQAGQRRLTLNRSLGDMWYVNNAARTFRGKVQTFCLDQLQTQFDADGRPVPIQTFNDPECRDVGLGAGVCAQEGYVMVSPYWDPSGPQIKVCAFDAQARSTGVNDITCDLYNPDRGCGCGPNMRHCMREFSESPPLREALAEEPARIFEWIVREDRPYLEAFTTQATFVNGPSSHYYRYQSGARALELGGAVSYEADVGEVPDIGYTNDADWQMIQRGASHAGVLTTFGYLMRFASNRARANRFYTAFYCDPFVPKADGLPAEGENPSPNLRERAGCADCHQVLEPAASHWGRWRTGGTYGVFEPDLLSFEEPRTDCQCGPGTSRMNCSAFCDTYFVTANNSHADTYEAYAGLPMASTYLEAGESPALDAGPAALVDEPGEQSRIASCTVRTLAESLLNRPVSSSELTWLQEHTTRFEDGGMSFTSLVRALVNDPKYRSIR